MIIRPSSQQSQSRKITLLLFEGTEAQTDGLAEWVQAAVDAHTVQLLAAAAVELEALEAWGDEPDMGEGDVGESTTPLHGNTDAAAEGHDIVAKGLAAAEAFFGVCPDAAHGVVSQWLGEDILEDNLQMVIDVVGIPVQQIDSAVRHD